VFNTELFAGRGEKGFNPNLSEREKLLTALKGMKKSGFIATGGVIFSLTFVFILSGEV
jgi:hypothetical protein